MAGVAAIGVRQRFNPLNARMNYSHPLAKDLLFCGIVYLGVDLMKNRNCFDSRTEKNPGGFGVARQIRFDADRTTDMTFTTGSFTVAAATNFLGTPTGGENIFRRSNYTSESSNAGWNLQFNVSGGATTNLEIFRNNSSASYTFQASGLARHGTSVSTSDGVTKKIFSNGLEIGSSTTGNLNPLDANTTVQMNFGATSASIACAWNRVLSTNEIAMFHADPYCMLSY